MTQLYGQPYLRRLLGRELPLEAGLVVPVDAAAVAGPIAVDVVEEAIDVADVDDEGVGVVVIVKGAHDDFVDHVNVKAAGQVFAQNVNKTGKFASAISNDTSPNLDCVVLAQRRV